MFFTKITCDKKKTNIHVAKISQSHLVHVLPELHELHHLRTAQLLKEAKATKGAAHFFWSTQRGKMVIHSDV